MGLRTFHFPFRGGLVMKLLNIIMIATVTLGACADASLAATFPESKTGLSAQPTQKPTSSIPPAQQAAVTNALNKQPLNFEKNLGQTDPRVQYISRGSNYTVFLTSDEAVIAVPVRTKGASFEAAYPGSRHTGRARTSTAAPEMAVLRVKLEGANPAPEITASDPLVTRSYYVPKGTTGPLPATPHFGRVNYAQVYPGIDLTYYGNQRQVQFDFIIAPMADPHQIVLSFQGAESIQKADDGHLSLLVQGQEIRLEEPFIYQVVEGRRTEVTGSFAVEKESRVRFKVDGYNASLPLVIDPVINATYLGTASGEFVGAIALNAAGEVYVLGITDDYVNFPLGIQGITDGIAIVGDSFGCFLSKFDSQLDSLLLSIIFPSFRCDAMATAPNGDIEIIGLHLSTLPNLEVKRVHESNGNVSVTQGPTLIQFNGYDGINDFHVDSSGNRYLLGNCGSFDPLKPLPNGFSTTPLVGRCEDSLSGTSEMVLAKYDSGWNLVYGTYTFGLPWQMWSGNPWQGLAVDDAGVAYVVGRTDSPNFPTTLNARNTYLQYCINTSICSPPFLMKVDTTQQGTNSLVYSTILDPIAADATGVALDSVGGKLYVAGPTIELPSNSSLFTVGGAYSNDGYGVYVTEMILSRLPSDPVVFTSIFGVRGGNLAVDVHGISLTSSGEIVVYGVDLGGFICDTCIGFPYVDPIFPPPGPDRFCGGFLSKLSALGDQLVFSTPLSNDCSLATPHVAVSDSTPGAGVDLYVAMRMDSVFWNGINYTPNYATPNAYQDSPPGGDSDILIFSLTWPTMHGQITLPGTDVGLSFTTSQGNVTVNFSNVTQFGLTSVTTTTVGPPLPTGFIVNGVYYDITTTAQYTGPVTVCFTGTFLGTEIIEHYENGWVPLDTQLLPPGGPYTTICGQTLSLSPFVVASLTNLAPSVNAGPNQTVEATSTDGATVTLSGSGSDPDGDTLTFSWSGPCGSASSAMATLTCPLGVDNMTLTVDDGHGGVASAVVVITVQDTTPPAVTVPGNISGVKATGPAGAVVTYPGATATDWVDGSITPTCTPASGSTFAVGTTTVTCSAKDKAGNTGSNTFTVMVVVDATPPILTVPSNITKEATSSAGAIVTFVASATDGVDPSPTVTCAPTSGSTFALGTTTVSCTAKDASGNTSAPKTFSVTVQDTTPPALDLPANITTPATGSNGAVVTFTTTASDLVDGVVAVICSPASGSAFHWNTTTTVACSATDAHSNKASGSFTVTVTNDAPIVALTGGPTTQNVQYSDLIVSLTFTVGDIDNQGTLNVAVTGQPAGITLTAGSASGTYVLSGKVADKPGTYLATVIASDGLSTGSTAVSIVVTREDARATYTGPLSVPTSSLTSTTANVLLTATIQDITAVTIDPAYDANPGDIRNTVVRFINRETGALLCTAPVGLVNPADLKTGTISCATTLSVDSTGAQQYTIGIIVDDYNGQQSYYLRNQSEEDGVVNVYQAVTGMITGGGYLTMYTPTKSAGQYVGDAGKKTNFGFNVKYNKNGTNLQGNLNFIIRSGGRVYQVKSNSMNSLGITPSKCTSTATNPCLATFTSKANLTDITNPAGPISLGGNLNMIVTMTDKGEPGSSDTFGITLYGSSNQILFSSNWDTTKTIEQLLGGGNVVVH